MVHGVTALSMAWFTLRYACFSRPLSGSRTSHGPCRPLSWGWLIISGFCGGHGPGETPGPFPNPEAKAWHGDGTAPGRVWESSTPPQITSEDPRSSMAPGDFSYPGTGSRRMPSGRHTPADNERMGRTGVPARPLSYLAGPAGVSTRSSRHRPGLRDRPSPPPVNGRHHLGAWQSIRRYGAGRDGTYGA